jgi:hypothetical protein
LFEAADPPLTDRAGFLDAVATWLGEHPEAILEWRSYSEDKRSSPSPYFGHGSTALEVGHYTEAHEAVDVTIHTDPVQACADFLYRESTWVLKRHPVTIRPE